MTTWDRIELIRSKTGPPSDYIPFCLTASWSSTGTGWTGTIRPSWGSPGTGAPR